MAEMRHLSFIQPYGYYTSSCGYCGSRVTSDSVQDDSSASLYAKAKSLTVDHYKQLLDRGWRRSGSLLYRPDNLHSCCPHYTIRLPVSSFTPRRDQRSACHRFNRFVLGPSYASEAAKLYPKSKADKAKLKSSFDLVESIHEAEYATLRACRPDLEPQYRFEVSLEPDSFTDEKYDLYLNYQEAVHHEPASKSSPEQFRRFLCDSPLNRTERLVNDGVAQKLGSYHQMYRLNGRLIAIGVLDLLPGCVSGVYFIYHSDFEKYSFGKLSALREASLTLEGGYENYYMGYYIHSCPKMQYKFNYTPQHVLDIKTYAWDPADEEYKKLMDKHRYFSLEVVREEAKRRGVDVLAVEEGWPQTSAWAGGDAPAKVIEELHNKEGVSLFELDFPGMMTLEELRASGFSIGGMLSKDDDQGEIEPLLPPERQILVDQYLDKGGNLFSYLAELVACVGVDLAKELVVVLR